MTPVFPSYWTSVHPSKSMYKALRRDRTGTSPKPKSIVVKGSERTVEDTRRPARVNVPRRQLPVEEQEE